MRACSCKYTRDRSDVSFALMSLEDGAVQEALCPGATYALQVFFPEPRRGLLTASQGVLANHTDAVW